jgi:beta-hydroxylase
MYNYYNFIFLLIIFIVILSSISYIINNENLLILKEKKKDKLFYNSKEINNNLKKIDKYKDQILKEVEIVYYYNQSDWNVWPEKYLYNNQDGWKIFPFFAFGIWVKENCEKCPTIFNFIKKIKGLKLATLSKLKAGTKLEKHKGWASHSNYVIRCHYGLIVPEESYVYVEDNLDKTKYEIKYHKKFEWLIFDDSKTHYAENKSKSDRIILILDVDRPNDIEIGNSDIGDSKELLEIVNYFKKKNL